MIPQLAGVALMVSFNFSPMGNFKVYPELIWENDHACLNIALPDMRKPYIPNFDWC